MGRTINRVPYTVNIPSSSDIKKYHHNHYNWKGIVENKNVLSVDQESFEDAVNVYSDKYNLLRSRPSLKPSKIQHDKFDNSDIKYVWNLDIGSLYHIVNDDADEYHLLSSNDELNYDFEADTFSKAVSLKNNLITFNKFNFLDLKTKTFKELDDVLYIPKEIQGISEQPNYFTDAKRIIYFVEDVYSEERTDLVGYVYDIILDDVVIYEDAYIDYFEKLKSIFIPFSSTVTSDKAEIMDCSYNEILRSDVLLIEEGIDVSPYARHRVLSDTFSLILRDDFKPIAVSQDGDIVYDIKMDASSITINYFNVINRSYGTIVKDISSLLSINRLKDLVHANVKNLNSYAVTFRYDDTSASILVQGDDLKLFKFGQWFFDDNNCWCLLGEERDGQYVDILYKLSADALEEFSVLGDLQSAYYSFIPTSGRKDISFHDGKARYVFLANGIYILATLDLNTKNKVFLNIMKPDGQVKDTYALSFGNMSTFTVVTAYSAYQYLYEGNLLIYSNETIAGRPREMLLSKYAYDKEPNDSTYSKMLTNNFKLLGKKLELSRMEGTRFVEPKPDIVKVLGNKIVMSKEGTLYISEYVEELGEYKLYFPHKTDFVKKITNIQYINDAQFAVFLDDEIYYVIADVNDKGETFYSYSKSKLDIGCSEGSDVITSFDGVYSIFPSKRGLAYISYQQFVASTDQTATFVSDTINERFSKFNDGPIKLGKFDYWVYAYKENGNELYLLDGRNSSWWYWSLPDNVKLVDKELKFLIDGSLYELDFGDNDYYDFINNEERKIEWKVTSQKLHLNAINNYKHIESLSLSTVTDSKDLISLDLQCICYRDVLDKRKKEVMEYYVNSVNTFVEKLNYSKVMEFQYSLISDDDTFYQTPLSLSNISVKYKIGGTIR